MERSIVIFVIMVIFAVCNICAGHRSMFYFYVSVVTKVRLQMMLSLFGAFSRTINILVTFSFLHLSNKTLRTHNRYVSRTDKQHLSRPQTTTCTRSGYTTDESNQQCERFQDAQSHLAIATVPRSKYLVTKLNNTGHNYNRALTLIRRSDPQRKRLDTVRTCGPEVIPYFSD